MTVGDLVYVSAGEFYNGIGVIVEFDEEFSCLVLETTGYLHYYYVEELEVIG